MSRNCILFACLFLLGAVPTSSAERVGITIERHAPGAPVTLGVPFPRGAVDSPDHVRVLEPSGQEIPAQVDEVTTWAPADRSLKWAWVFFFADRGDRYILEFGKGTRRTLPTGADLQVLNNPRERGQVDIVAGRLHATLSQGEGGFLSDVRLDLEGDGFEDDDVIAVGAQKRGSFVDLLDDAGFDPAGAIVHRTSLERRTDLLRVDPLERPIDDSWTPATLAAALAKVNRIPDAPSWYRREFSEAARRRSPNWAPEHGLRFFGWTHAHGLPWALAVLAEPTVRKTSAAPGRTGPKPHPE